MREHNDFAVRRVKHAVRRVKHAVRRVNRAVRHGRREALGKLEASQPFQQLSLAFLAPC